VKARAFAYAAATAELVGVPLCAAVAAAVIFGVVVAILGVDPLQVYGLMWLGGFGTWFSWQNTLVRSAPLLLTALCFALPAQMGFAIIGGEGAFIMGGLAASLASLVAPSAPAPVMLGLMALAGGVAGAVVVGISGCLRVFRGVNETISSLLMTYLSIAIFNQLVEGPFRDHSDLDQASTLPIPDQGVIGDIPGTSVHWGLVVGVVACLIATLVIYRTGLGFAMRVLGGNGRAARMVGRANNSLIAGYGYQGIFVSFIARQNPLLIMPVALLLGGIGASGGLVQRRTGLPYASVLVLQGVIFLCVLVAETLRGRGPLGSWRQTMVLIPDPLADPLADTEAGS
jgi:ABC-type uncharacterized transport system permease subunit